MGSHLVHIYRREKREGALIITEIFGVVEGVENEQQTPFTSADELWDIVAGRDPARAAAGKKVRRSVKRKGK